MVKHILASGAKATFKYLLVGLVIIVTIFPVFWLFRTSFLEPSLLTKLPPPIKFRPTLENFRVVLEHHDFLKYVKNSFVCAVASTLIALVIGLPAAYSFSRFNFLGKNLLSMTVLLLYVTPPVAIIIPLYLIFRIVGLSSSLLSLILTHGVITMPLTIWLLRGFIARIPVELEQAALIDGCSRFSVLWCVVIPILGPGIAATAVLAFLYSWNDFIYAVMLTGREARTSPVIISGFITDKAEYWDRIATSGALVLLPPLIMSMLVQRYLAEGLTAGAVKE